ncbi:MAG: NifU family protein [Patescibacteria group bacterium]|nr:NifU family protein [Patescibacteria group bacterium]
MEDKIKQVLNKVRPNLQADGGDVEFISWDKKIGQVKVRLVGMCAGCPMAQATLEQGIAAEIKKAIPEVKAVVLG